MYYIIKFSPNGTYYQGMTRIGPAFGAKKQEALRFTDKQDAVRETTRHWGFTITEIEEVEA